MAAKWFARSFARNLHHLKQDAARDIGNQAQQVFFGDTESLPRQGHLAPGNLRGYQVSEFHRVVVFTSPQEAVDDIGKGPAGHSKPTATGTNYTHILGPRKRIFAPRPSYPLAANSTLKPVTLREKWSITTQAGKKKMIRDRSPREWRRCEDSLNSRRPITEALNRRRTRWGFSSDTSPSKREGKIELRDLL